VGDELSEKVREAIRELGYQANEMAASMKRRTTNNIGIVLPNIGMVFFPDVLKGIETAAKENGYKLFYFSTDYDFDKEKEYINLLSLGWVDGIILDSCCPMDKIDEYGKMLEGEDSGKSLPIVTLEAPFGTDRLGTIVLDEVTFTEEVIDHLVSLGHRRIELLMGPRHIPMYSNNIEGVRRAFKRHGIPLCEENIMFGDYFAESGYNAVKKALDEGRSFTALFSANDQMAIGAIKAIKEKGLRVPEDIAVTGVDGIYVTTLIDPPLTTVELPRYKLGYTAGTMLAEMIRNPDKRGEHIILPGKLVVRKSTNPGFTENWELTGW
jgi:DNA-binding LacI/PurR family transcriptional regulator